MDAEFNPFFGELEYTYLDWFEKYLSNKGVRLDFIT
jgi:hypothetical protein